MPAMSPSPDFVLAVDFGGTKLDVATAAPAGRIPTAAPRPTAARDARILPAERLDTDAAGGAEQAVERALATARRLRDATALQTGGTLVAARAPRPGPRAAHPH